MSQRALRAPQPRARRGREEEGAGERRRRDPARGRGFAAGEALRRPVAEADMPGTTAPAGQTIGEWRQDKDAILAEAHARGTEEERRERLVQSSEAMVGEPLWGTDDPDYGPLGCPHLPFMAAVDAGLITKAQSMRLLSRHRATNADILQLVLETIDFVPPRQAPPSRLYPQGRPKRGDIAIFTDPEGGMTFLDHVAIFTGNGGEIISLQASYEPDASEHPTMKTTVEEYIAKMGEGAVSAVVICPFPF